MSAKLKKEALANHLRDVIDSLMIADLYIAKHYGPKTLIRKELIKQIQTHRKKVNDIVMEKSCD